MPVATTNEQLADHLISLDPQWAAWQNIGLRGAGFPAALVLRLATPECIQILDSLFRKEMEVSSTFEQMESMVRRELDLLAERGEWSDKVARKRLLKLAKGLRKSNVPDDFVDLFGDDLATRAKALQKQVQELEGQFRDSYDKTIRTQSGELHQIAGMDLFQEAILWQNRSAFHTAVQKIANRGPEETKRDSQRRQHEELVANYLQRYTLKNDTIGFFGPIAIVQFDPSREESIVEAGAELLAERGVYLEAWCIVALAEEFASWDEVRVWLPPRQKPYVKLVGQTLQIPMSPPVDLPPEAAAVLALCTGQLPAKEFSARLRSDGLPIPDEKVYGMLEHLVGQELISWGFEIKVSPFSIDLLREQIQSIGDRSARSRCLALVEELDAARQAIADQAGNVSGLDTAIKALNETFTRITGQDSSRRGGKTYAARTLVYEDCRRDVEMQIGSELRTEIARPLSLVLQSARWFEKQAADVFLKVALDLYERIRAKTGSEIIEAAYLWQMIEPVFYDPDKNPLPMTALKAVQDHWAEILAPYLSTQEGSRHIQLDSASIQAEIEERFPVIYPGWQLSRYHNPDVMIAAESVEAINAGDYELVLGELHVGLNTLNIWAMMVQNEHRETILKGLDLDLPEPRLVVAMGKDSPVHNTRTQVAYRSPKDFIVPSPDHTSPIPENQLVQITDMVIERHGDRLELRTREGNLRFDIIEALGQFLSFRVLRDFEITGDQAYQPRITLDRMVIQRESWRFSAEDLDFALEKDTAERFRQARMWALEHKLPRFFFVKVPVETKPFYVDLETPIFVDILAKVLRSTRERDPNPNNVKITEMLPSPYQLWLEDSQGQRYTSELRVVVTDLATR